MEVCERLIGSPERIAVICGISDKSPYAWRLPSKGRDAGDLPSAIYGRRLLAHSDANALGLTALHLILGASEAEIEAILAARGAPPPAFASRRRAGPHHLQAAE